LTIMETESSLLVDLGDFLGIGRSNEPTKINGNQHLVLFCCNDGGKDDDNRQSRTDDNNDVPLRAIREV
jgi:hypothetical protein